MPSAQHTAIAVIHGLGANRLVMYPLASRLRYQGYDVTNWGYRSILSDIRTHASAFQRVLESLDANPSFNKLHIVAHSMGSIVARVALADCHPKKLQRMVFIAPPNAGSHAATALSPYLGWLSTTLTEIADTENSFVNSLPNLLDERYEVGIVRAENDLVVSADSTQLTGARAYASVPGMHSGILLRASTAKLVHRFLKTGTFDLSHVESQPN